jgi:PhnB protein
MQSKLNPYISFQGNAREAMEFYKSVFGGKLDLNTFKEGGVPAGKGNEDQIMHAMLVAENGITLMASDMPETGGMEYKAGTNISVSLSGDDEAELSGYYNKLAEEGTVVEPLEKAPWGDMFGMVTDKFGVFWLVNIAGKKA